MYDYSKLIGRIKECCGTQSVFAKKMHLSERTISQKLKQRVDFTQGEIQCALDILSLTNDEIQLYFFTLNVQ